MPIRKLVKLQFYFPFIKNLFCFLVIISAIFGWITFYTNILPTIPPNSYIMHYFAGLLLNTTAILVYPLILSLFLLNYYINEKIDNLPLTISYEVKTILLKILFHFISNHKNNQSKYSTKLTLEINKLINTLENNSMIYADLDKDDFPYLHKFLRRFTNKSNNTKDQNNTKYTKYTKYTTLISENDRQKLNINHQNLLTMDEVDNQLNDLVYSNISKIKDNVHILNDK